MLQRVERWFSKLRSNNASATKLGIAFLPSSMTAVCWDSVDGAYRSCYVDVLDGNYRQGLIDLLAKMEVAAAECAIVLSAEQYQMLQTERPTVKPEEMLQALPWVIKDMISYKLDDLVVDYVDVISPANAQQNNKINVICASRATLTQLVADCDFLDLSIQSITTEEFASQKLVPVNDDAVILVTQQHGQEINIQIVKSGQVYFSRRLRGYSSLANLDAEQLQYGISDNLILELQRSSDYFESQLRQAPIRKVLLCLPTDHVQVIASAIEENLPFKVESIENESMVEPDQRVRTSMHIAFAALQLLLTEEHAKP